MMLALRFAQPAGFGSRCNTFLIPSPHMCCSLPPQKLLLSPRPPPPSTPPLQCFLMNSPTHEHIRRSGLETSSPQVTDVCMWGDNRNEYGTTDIFVIRPDLASHSHSHTRIQNQPHYFLPDGSFRSFCHHGAKKQEGFPNCGFFSLFVGLCCREKQRLM